MHSIGFNAYLNIFLDASMVIKVLRVVLFGEIFIHMPIKVANKAILFHYCVIEQMCKLNGVWLTVNVCANCTQE